MHVEFIGVAGAGKSSLLGLIIRQAEINAIPVCCHYGKESSISFKSKVKALAIASICAYRCGANNLSSYKKNIASLYQLGCSLISIHAGSKNLVDEGVFHKSRAIFRSSKKEYREVIEIISRYYQLPDVLISVKSKSKVIYGRRKARNKKHDKVTRAYVDLLVSEYDQNIKCIIEFASKKKHNFKIVYIENNDSDFFNLESEAIKIVEEFLR